MIDAAVRKGRAARCEDCGGAIVDAEGLGGISSPDLVAGMLELAAGTEEVGVGCPLCAAPMRVITVFGVELDVCIDDEVIWFDSRELARFRPGLGDQSLANPGTARYMGVGSADSFIRTLLTWW